MYSSKVLFFGYSGSKAGRIEGLWVVWRDDGGSQRQQLDKTRGEHSHVWSRVPSGAYLDRGANVLWSLKGVCRWELSPREASKHCRHDSCYGFAVSTSSLDHLAVL